jgi:hypothetical protein
MPETIAARLIAIPSAIPCPFAKRLNPVPRPSNATINPMMKPTMNPNGASAKKTSIPRPPSESET